MVTTRTANGVHVVSAQGELDRFDQPELRNQLERALGHRSCRRVDLDLRQVNFIDSSCVSLVKELAERMVEARREFRLHSSPQVEKTFALLKDAG